MTCIDEVVMPQRWLLVGKTGNVATVYLTLWFKPTKYTFMCFTTKVDFIAWEVRLASKYIGDKSIYYICYILHFAMKIGRRLGSKTNGTSQISWRSGGWFNKKMSSYQYRKSHCGDKTILRPSYLYNGISYTGKMTSLYWIRAQVTVNPYTVFPKNLAQGLDPARFVGKTVFGLANKVLESDTALPYSLSSVIVYWQLTVLWPLRWHHMSVLTF